MIFGSARACCTKYHMNNVCEYKDGCTGKISSMEITKAPTSQPTKRPTREVRSYGIESIVPFVEE